MNRTPQLHEIEELGGLTCIEPAAGLARVQATARARAARFPSVLRGAPAALTAGLGWTALGVVTLAAALGIHGAVVGGTPAQHGQQTNLSSPAAIVPSVVAPTQPVNGVVPPGHGPSGAPTAAPTGGAPHSANPTSAPPTSTTSGCPSGQVMSGGQCVPAQSGDLLSNSSFEQSSLAMWAPWQATETRTLLATAPDGNYVLEVAYQTGNWFTVDSWQQPVTAVSGQTYTVGVYVAAATHQEIGKKLDLVIRESVHDAQHTNQRTKTVEVTLQSSFQYITVSMAATSNDTMSAYLGPPPGTGVSGDAFYADVFTMTNS